MTKIYLNAPDNFLIRVNTELLTKTVDNSFSTQYIYYDRHTTIDDVSSDVITTDIANLSTQK